MVVLALIAVISALVSIGIWVGRVNQDRKSIKGIGEWKAEVEADRKNFKDFMKEIRKDVRQIRKQMERIFERLPSPRIAQGESPLRLTEFGEKLAEFLGSREWAREVAPTLTGEVKGMEPFEIDAFADSYVKEHLDGWKQKIAACAYEFGVKREDVPVVLRLSLRDALISGHDATDTAPSRQTG